KPSFPVPLPEASANALSVAGEVAGFRPNHPITVFAQLLKNPGLSAAATVGAAVEEAVLVDALESVFKFLSAAAAGLLVLAATTTDFAAAGVGASSSTSASSSISASATAIVAPCGLKRARAMPRRSPINDASTNKFMQNTSA